MSNTFYDFLYLVNGEYLTYSQVEEYCESTGYQLLGIVNNAKRKPIGKEKNLDCFEKNFRKEELIGEFPFFYSSRHTNDNIDEY